MSDTTRVKLTRSQEDYLEAIYALTLESGAARVRDIAKRLDVGSSAVTAALKALAKRDLVNYDPYELVTLTGPGRAAASRVDSRHRTLRRFLIEVLGIQDERAEANACRIEHAVDDVVLDRLRQMTELTQGRGHELNGRPTEPKRFFASRAVRPPRDGETPRRRKPKQ